MCSRLEECRLLGAQRIEHEAFALEERADGAAVGEGVDERRDAREALDHELQVGEVGELPHAKLLLCWWWWWRWRAGGRAQR